MLLLFLLLLLLLLLLLGLKAKNAQKKYRLILEKKQQVSIAQLCQGCPSQFAEFLVVVFVVVCVVLKINVFLFLSAVIF